MLNLFHRTLAWPTYGYTGSVLIPSFIVT